MSNNVTSIDPQEVARYTALADTWWDQHGPFWPLHKLNGLRVNFITNTLCRLLQRYPEDHQPLAGLRVLDIGCGGGILSEAIAARGAAVHGIDVVEKNIAAARLHARQKGLDIRYQNSSAEALAQQDLRYDVVLNMEVVEHVADLPAFLHACNTLVRTGGVQFIATINRTTLAWLFAIVGAEYVLGWLPKGTHQWRRFPTPYELQGMLDNDGLRVIEKIGVKVNPLTRGMSLSRLMAVNYMLVAEKAPHKD